MQKQKEDEQLTSIWQGSRYTAMSTAATIATRYGREAAKEYDPSTNCFTYKGWLQRGYQVRKGEKGIKSTTIIEITDKNGDTVKRPRAITLFYRLQVDTIKK